MLTLAELPVMVPAMLTALSMLVPLKFLASPMRLMELVAALPLIAPEKLSAFNEALLDAADVPLMVSLLVTPATVPMSMVPPKEMPSELLLEPSSVTSPLMVKVRPPCTKMPRCLVF